MKELGNLAIICAKRNDLELSIKEGRVFVRLENSPTMMSAEWDNDEKISNIIHELNFGTYPKKKIMSESNAFDFLKQYIGQSLHVIETAGQYIVETSEHDIILSSDPNGLTGLYCPAEKLYWHTGHLAACAYDGGGKNSTIYIECVHCSKILYSADSASDNTEILMHYSHRNFTPEQAREYLMHGTTISPPDVFLANLQEFFDFIVPEEEEHNYLCELGAESWKQLSDLCRSGDWDNGKNLISITYKGDPLVIDLHNFKKEAKEGR